MTERHSDPTTGFEHLRVIDLRLVQDRNDEWHLYVEGTFAAYPAFLVRRRSTPFLMRLWSHFWFKKPWGPSVMGYRNAQPRKTRLWHATLLYRHPEGQIHLRQGWVWAAEGTHAIHDIRDSAEDGPIPRGAVLFAEAICSEDFADRERLEAERIAAAKGEKDR